MFITPAQRATIDRDVASLTGPGVGIADIRVFIAESYAVEAYGETPGTLVYSASHQGLKADHSDWSFVSASVRPDGSILGG